MSLTEIDIAPESLLIDEPEPKLNMPVDKSTLSAKDRVTPGATVNWPTAVDSDTVKLALTSQTIGSQAPDAPHDPFWHERLD